MAEYLLLANESKHEYVHPSQLGSGQKSAEISDRGHAPGGAMAALWHLLWPPMLGDQSYEPVDRINDQVHGRWVGDNIRIVSDYVESDAYRTILDEWTEISDLIRPVLSWWCGAIYEQRDGHWFRHEDPDR